MTSEWDCVIVGGGAAGLSAGLVLGRARRRTLLLDVGGQSNRVAEGIGGLLGNDRRPPAEFYAAGREELGAYDAVEPRDAEAIRGERRPDGFALELGDGTEISTRTVLLATGMEYRYPDLPGVRERWGRSVFHCPFCHGWEVRDRHLGVLGGDEMAVHRALLLRAWSDSVTLLSGGGELPPEAAAPLAQAGIIVDDRPVAALEGPGSSLAAVAFADGTNRALDALMVPVTLHRRSDLPNQLGASQAPASPFIDEAIEADATGNVGVPGLYAAGDLLARAPSVASAISTGNFAAAQIVAFLTTA